MREVQGWCGGSKYVTSNHGTSICTNLKYMYIYSTVLTSHHHHMITMHFIHCVHMFTYKHIKIHQMLKNVEFLI